MGTATFCVVGVFLEQDVGGLSGCRLRCPFVYLGTRAETFASCCEIVLPFHGSLAITVYLFYRFKLFHGFLFNRCRGAMVGLSLLTARYCGLLGSPHSTLAKCGPERLT